MMVCGRCVSDAFVLQRIKSGQYAVDLPSAIRAFGTNFLAVSPIPAEYAEEIRSRKQKLSFQDDQNVCYILKPGSK